MDNINTQKRFIFKKDYQDKQGTIPAGSQIDFVHQTYYFNGGMCDNYSRGLFNYLVNTPKLFNEYLKEVPIPYNKI